MLNPLDYQNLVERVARRYRTVEVELDDLISYGNIGLLEGIKYLEKKKIEVDDDYTVRSYLYQYVRAGIRKGLSYERTIIIPHYIYSRAWKVALGYSTLDDIASDPSRRGTPTAELVSEALPVVLMNRVRDAYGKDGPIGDILYQIPATEENPIELSPDIKEAFDSLSDQRALIMQYYLGLDGSLPRKKYEVAALVGLTAHQVERIIHLSLKQLRRKIFTKPKPTPEETEIIIQESKVLCGREYRIYLAKLDRRLGVGVSWIRDNLKCSCKTIARGKKELMAEEAAKVLSASSSPPIPSYDETQASLCFAGTAS